MVEGTTLTLMQNTRQGQAWFELWTIAPGVCESVGSYGAYPQALSAVQTWQAFLQGGGTVQGWLTHSQPLAIEV